MPVGMAPRAGSASGPVSRTFTSRYNHLVPATTKLILRQQQQRLASSYYQVRLPNGNTARVPLLKAPSHFGHYTSRVNRPYNEDRYYAGVLELPRASSLVPKRLRETQPDAPATRRVFQFSVFDGHGGAECAEFLEANLANYIETVDLASGPALQEAYRKRVGGYWRAWKNEVQKYIARLTPWDDLELRVPLAYLTADLDYTGARRPAGSTCTSVFLYAEQDDLAFWDPGATTHLITGHVGDTRCVVADARGNVTPLTTAHHPSSAVEAGRLRRYATSFFTDSFGEERYYQYANTRAFGDARAKARGVTAEPEVIECRLGAIPPGRSESKNVHVLSGQEAFLVIVSDGVSGVVSDQEIADLVIQTANQSGRRRGTPHDAAHELVEYAAAVGGEDNATALVIRLPSWGNWDGWTDRTGQLREDRMKAVAEAPERRRR